MKEIGQSTLIGKKAVKVGFAYAAHPVHKNHFLEVTLYKLTDTEFVMCMSDGPDPFHVGLSRLGLGALVAGELFAPFAQRHLKGTPLPELRKVLEEALPETMPGVKFEWF